MKKIIIAFLLLVPFFAYGQSFNSLPNAGAVTTSDSILIHRPGSYYKAKLSNFPFGAGTVTSVSVTSANGVSGSVATATTTPAITLTLGAITPTTVNGLTLSGTGGSTIAFGTGGTVLYNGANTLTGLTQFSGTTHAGLRLNNLTTVQRDALTGTQGMLLANTNTLVPSYYNGTSWLNVPAIAGTLAVASGKTLTSSNTLTFTGTDASSVAFGAGGTVLYTTGISNTAYAASWSGVTTIAPSKNAVYNKVQTLLPKTGGQMSGDITLVDGTSILFSPTGEQGGLQNDSSNKTIHLYANNFEIAAQNGINIFSDNIDGNDDIVISATSGADLIMVGDTTEINGALFIGTGSAASIKMGSASSTSIGIYGNPGATTASAGYVGERITASQSTYTNYTTTATYQAITSITLTAGDWDISAFMTYSSNSATITAAANSIFVISTTTASASGAVEGKNIAYIPQAALLGTSKFSESISPYQVNPSSTTTYYLNTQATFTIGNPQFVGTIRAVRIR